MKKIFIRVITSLFIVFLIYEFGYAPRITVEDVELIDVVIDKVQHEGYIYYYDINENDSKRLMENNVRWKKALITFKYDLSFFRTYEEVRGKYATPEKLPEIIVGKKPDMATIGLITIWSRWDIPWKYKMTLLSDKFRMTVLIDPKNYNDMEILEMLKTVEIELTGYYDIGYMGLALYNPILATLPLAK